MPPITSQFRQGQPFEPSADQFNRWQRSSDWVDDRRSTTGGSIGDGGSATNIVLVKNTTSATIPRGSVVGLTTIIVKPTDTTALSSVSLEAVTPTAEHAAQRRLAVLLEPANANTLARAYVSGHFPAKVTMSNTSHRFAAVAPGAGATKLVSDGAAGEYIIIAVTPGTGDQWAIVSPAPAVPTFVRVVVTGALLDASSKWVRHAFVGNPLTGGINNAWYNLIGYPAALQSSMGTLATFNASPWGTRDTTTTVEVWNEMGHNIPTGAIVNGMVVGRRPNDTAGGNRLIISVARPVQTFYATTGVADTALDSNGTAIKGAYTYPLYAVRKQTKAYVSGSGSTARIDPAWTQITGGLGAYSYPPAGYAGALNFDEFSAQQDGNAAGPLTIPIPPGRVVEAQFIRTDGGQEELWFRSVPPLQMTTGGTGTIPRSVNARS